MKIANQFTVSAPISHAWDVLCDPEQVIPLMPGAQLTGHEGDDYLGKVKVKVGPVTSEFSGKVRFVEQDSDRHRAVIDAKGKESRGTGNAAATVTAQLREDGERTSVTVDTDLKIVGKLAQFGSGMLQQVSEKLLGQFVESLEAKLASEKTSEETAPLASSATPTSAATPQNAAGPVTSAAPGSPRPAAATPNASPAPEPIDLLALAGGGQLKKYGSVALAVCAALALIWLLRRRR
ncbi:membrane oxidoreductase [Mycobacterium vulneris]|jgi:carbon monoxide dehydrogenase subunit G|uniref:Membrane oxidoreductase n=1 Tax=Mycolicibacterium vulneris TaxID=547163 RepID=A0A1X2LEV0_9MYCO|nr:SRPBCC domain-containing protein [Mycolicibacterium vulneris]OSC32508.1 membrane oxidoreductase [Mycolicibacterium vulneris]